MTQNLKEQPQREVSLQVQMPRSLLRQLKLAALENDTSVRAIVLKALSLAGFEVGEISDRRRTGGIKS